MTPWASMFGTEYALRNGADPLGDAEFFRTALFHLLINSVEVKRTLEFGASTGRNLLALGNILNCALEAVEINPVACQELRKHGIITHERDFLGPAGYSADLVVSKGLLIHVDPSDLDRAYKVLYSATTKYLLIAEYFSPTPVKISYRDNVGMWKRDFAGEILDRYDMKVLDYGFSWSRDVYPQDDVTWFLLER